MQKSNRQPILALDDVNIWYPESDEATLQHISFSLQPQSITMLIGPNGAGKSTILKAVIGALKHTGNISFNPSQHQMTQHLPASKDLGAIGYVPQRLDFDLSLPITVHDFLTLALLSCKHSAAEKQRFITTALSQVGATDLENTLLGSLSGGQRQRVVFARALIHQPSLLVLDEPESGIDFSGEHDLYSLLYSLVQKKGITAIIATHEMEIVSKYADLVLCINKKLICTGKPSEVLNQQVMNQVYGLETGYFHHHHLD